MILKPVIRAQNGHAKHEQTKGTKT